MPIINNTLLAGASGQGGGYQIEQSLRFNRSASAYLSKTFSSDGGDDYTISFWTKRCMSHSVIDFILGVPGNGGYGWQVHDFYINDDGVVARDSLSLYRDPSAWYHVCIQNDASTGNTIYINNEVVPMNGTSNVTTVNGATTHYIGRFGSSATHYYDGYMADWVFLSDRVAAPTDFGEYNDDGVWVPLDPSELDFSGTNSHWLNFADSANLGADASGNGFDFTTTNISADDQVTDTPTNNYATLNPLDKGSSATTADGNLQQTATTDHIVRATIAIPSTGKWAISGNVDATDFSFGVCTPDHSLTTKIGRSNYSWGAIDAPGAGFFRSEHDSVGTNSTVVSSVNDTFVIAYDADTGNLWLGRNHNSAGIAYLGGGDPAAGTSPTYTITSGDLNGKELFFAIGRKLSVSFGQIAQYETLPTGFNDLSTANLPTQAIKDGSKNFNGYLWTGNGASQRIASFQPITETYTIDNAARFNDDDSAYLTSTLGTATDTNRWTYSVWVKRGALPGTQMALINSNFAANDAGFMSIQFDSNNTFFMTGQSTRWRQTTQVFKDASAWYHIVVAVDTDQATANDRIKIYVNGAQVTDFSTTNNPSSGANLGLNQAAAHEIGRDASAIRYFDGYMADVNFIDGQQLAASDFGQTDSSTNRWIPKAYSGSYGNNGFFLEFGDSAALGDDTSGNANDFTSSGLASNDQVTDTPTKNYVVLNPNDDATGYTTPLISNGNLDVDDRTGNAVRGTFGFKKGYGKFVYEVNITNLIGSMDIGWSAAGVDLWAENGPELMYEDAGTKLVSADSSSTPTRTSYGASYTAGDVIRVETDFDSSVIEFFKNGTSQGTIDFSGMNDGTFYYPACYCNRVDAEFNFGQQSFIGTPTAGFEGLNTDNLPLTGGNISAFSWIKSRSTTYNHQLYDRVRGANEVLVSNSTAAATTDANGLQTFLLDGFQLGNSTNVNASGQTYVGWNWMTDTSGSGSSNTDGDIPSTIIADTTAGFSIVSWTLGSTDNQTVGHGLSSAPEFMFLKNRNAVGGWTTYHEYNTSQPETEYLRLGSSNATVDSALPWNDTAPTSSVFTIGDVSWFGSASDEMIMHCFRSIPGFSKMGSYTGNGSSDGPFVWCGFRPAWVLLKQTNIANNWIIYDAVRDTYNYANKYLHPDAASAEATYQEGVDLISNGFKLRHYNFGNTSGGTYIFAAFAEHPFGGDNVSPVPAR